LLTIPDMAARFDVPIGFSDHTLGNAAAISAVALGAVAVEKHFIDAHEPPTADSTFSCVPEGLRALRSDLDAAWKARGVVQYGATTSETPSLVYRRSLYVVSPVGKGETIEEHHVRSIRPGYGMPPRHLPEILGSRAARDLHPGEALKWDMVNRQ
jgi:pseudaminic acid synthase